MCAKINLIFRIKLRRMLITDIPVSYTHLDVYKRQLLELVKKGITAADIVTLKSFENAIMVHAAISGSTNAVMHIPAIAHEFGIEIDAEDVYKRQGWE